MAFTNVSNDFMNPMIPYYAEQSLQHAQKNPFDVAALAQAAHWADLLSRQRTAQALPAAHLATLRHCRHRQ